MVQVFSLSPDARSVVIVLTEEEYLLQTLGETRLVVGPLPETSGPVSEAAKASAISMARREVNAAFGVAERRERYYATGE